MVDPVRLVEDFCGQWCDGMERVRAALVHRFTPTTVWENVGFSRTVGAEEAAALWEGFAKIGFTDIRVEMLHIAARNNIVLTERIDHLMTPEGKVLFSPRVMGAFETDGEHITNWRDYTDPAVLAEIGARAAAQEQTGGSKA